MGRGAVDVSAEEDDARHRLAADLQVRDEERRATITQLRLVHEDDVWTTVGTPVLVQRKDRVTIEDFAVRSARGSGRVRGVIAMTGANDLEVVVEGLDLAVLRDLIPEEVGGQLVGRAHLGGTSRRRGSMPRPRSKLRRIGGVRYDELQARLAAGGGRMELHGRLAQTADRALLVDGSLPARLSFALGASR